MEGFRRGVVMWQWTVPSGGYVGDGISVLWKLQPGPVVGLVLCLPCGPSEMTTLSMLVDTAPKGQLPKACH